MLQVVLRCVSCPLSHKQSIKSELRVVSQKTFAGLSGGTLNEIDRAIKRKPPSCFCRPDNTQIAVAVWVYVILQQQHNLIFGTLIGQNCAIMGKFKPNPFKIVQLLQNVRPKHHSDFKQVRPLGPLIYDSCFMPFLSFLYFIFWKINLYCYVDTFQINLASEQGNNVTTSRTHNVITMSCVGNLVSQEFMKQ